MNGTAMHADSAPGEAATDSEYSESFPTKETLAELGRRLPGTAKRYVLEIFPIVQWLPHYNLKWGLGDVIAGVGTLN
jgi:sodium-independent sulfate anion transporter 11